MSGKCVLSISFRVNNTQSVSGTVHNKDVDVLYRRGKKKPWLLEAGLGDTVCSTDLYPLRDDAVSVLHSQRHKDRCRIFADRIVGARHCKTTSNRFKSTASQQ